MGDNEFTINGLEYALTESVLGNAPATEAEAKVDEVIAIKKLYKNLVPNTSISRSINKLVEEGIAFSQLESRAIAMIAEIVDVTKVVKKSYLNTTVYDAMSRQLAKHEPGLKLPLAKIAKIESIGADVELRHILSSYGNEVTKKILKVLVALQISLLNRQYCK